MKKQLSTLSLGLFVALGMTFTACSSSSSDDKQDQKPYIITFEDVNAEYLAGPTAYGDNLYPTYKGEESKPYVGYKDVHTGLNFKVSDDETEYGRFASYGVAISQWNNKDDEKYTNQCSVYFGDSNKKNGGNNNSATFAVVNVSTSENTANKSFLQFENEAELLSHVYITNTTYAALTMKNGNAFSKILNFDDKDWLKITIIGKDINDKVTGSVEHYLADFRTKDSKGISTAWEKVDLKALGKVYKVTFKMEGSDIGQYGLNTPAYFCMDDLTVLLEK